MKSMTPRLKTAAVSLYCLQQRINEKAAELEALKAEERALVETLNPVFAAEEDSARVTVKTDDYGALDVVYTLVERKVLDQARAAALLTTLGRRVPRKKQVYSYLKVTDRLER